MNVSKLSEYKCYYRQRLSVKVGMGIGEQNEGNDKNVENQSGSAGNKGGNVGNQGGNAGNQGGNLRIGMELMNQNCGEG